MKNRLLPILIVVAAVGGFLLTRSEPVSADAPTLAFTSNPFPLAVGPTRLYFTLETGDGPAIEDATINVTSSIETGGALSLASPTIRVVDGKFTVPVVYPRTGQWTIDVSVTLSGEQAPLRERYRVYVYGVSTHIGNNVRRYRSVSQIETALAVNPAREYWIVLPQGAREINMHSLSGEALIPSQINLKVSGQNTLIIQNDDVVDHTIGPFFVRSGETIRQEFRQPAVYEGVCSISGNNEINITVEG